MKKKDVILIILLLLLGIYECRAEIIVGDDDIFMKGVGYVVNVEYDKAYTCFDKASIDYQSMGNKEMEMKALQNMAVCAFWLGATDSCVVKMQQGIKIARELKNAFAEYEFYNNMYSICYIKVDMDRAMQLSQKIDSITKCSNDVRISFDNLHRLAQSAAEQQNLKLQEQYLLQREQLLGELPADMRETVKYNVYNELSTFYVSQQNLSKAKEYIRLNIRTSQEKLHKSILDYMVYGDEAIYCAFQNERQAAFEALDSMKYGLEHCKETSVIHWMSYWGNNGNVHEMFKEWTQAVDAYEKALDIAKGKEMSAWLLYQSYLLRLSNAYYYIGQFDRMRWCFQQNVELSKKRGFDLFAYTHALWLLAHFEMRTGEFDLGREHYMLSAEIIKKNIAGQLRYISVQERESFWQMFASHLWEMPAYAFMTGETQSLFTQKSYDALLFSKGLLLESDRSMAEAINKECTKEEQRMYYEMVNLQSALKTLTKNNEYNVEKANQLNKRIFSLDKQLTPIISRLGFTDFLNIDYMAIKDMLGEDEIILDFADYDGDVHQFVSFIINKEQAYPKLVKNFTTEDYKALIDGKPLDCLYNSQQGSRMLDLIWSSVSEEVKGKNTVYYIPSGLMHQIALESLPMKDGTLLGDHYHFVRLTSAREILKIKGSQKCSHRNANLYGNLTYDMDEIVMAKEAAHYKATNLLAMKRGGLTRGYGEWDDLKNTKEEVEAIRILLHKKKVYTKSMTGIKGTEESFFAMSGKAPQILHIATHGFYYTPEEAKKVDFLKDCQDAMQLSGLIMSGGNAEWTGKPIPKGVMGGVLTANDIATLDLRGTDLVVLSACQTGLGKVTPEGLYGLQRAFKKAGVQTIVMTLWNVSDVATKEFMVKFYEELTAGADKWNKRKAFENAKNHIRNNPDYKDPYYWAGFVMLD